MRAAGRNAGPISEEPIRTGIAAYRDALALVHEAAADMDVTANVIRQLHTIMYRYLPQPGGRWKMVDNETSNAMPPARCISLERITEESKATYYEALARSSQGWHEGRHDPHPWLDYFWGVMLRAYGEFTERVSGLNRGAGSWCGEWSTCVVTNRLPLRGWPNCTGISG